MKTLAFPRVYPQEGKRFLNNTQFALHAGRFLSDSQRKQYGKTCAEYDQARNICMVCGIFPDFIDVFTPKAFSCLLQEL